MTFEAYIAAEIAKYERYAAESGEDTSERNWHLARCWDLSKIRDKYRELHRNELQLFRDWLDDSYERHCMRSQDVTDRTKYVNAMNLVDEWRVSAPDSSTASASV